MGADSKIEWTDHTFNPWIGCAKVSEGCRGCYAAVNTFTRAQRAQGRELWGVDAERHLISEAKWREPIKWNRDAARDGVRKRVFCASMADVFEDRPDLVAPRARLFAVIAVTPHLDWLLLTKRPENIARLWPMEADEEGTSRAVPIVPMGAPNVWLGTTVENRAERKRWSHLKAIPAAVRFLSVEPLLEDADISTVLGVEWSDLMAEWLPEQIHVLGGHPAPDWVIVGCESGARARNHDGYEEHARKVIRQCRPGSVAVFHKQFPVGGRVSHDMAEWPEDLRVREFPKVRCEEVRRG